MLAAVSSHSLEEANIRHLACFSCFFSPVYFSSFVWSQLHLEARQRSIPRAPALMDWDKKGRGECRIAC